MGLGKNNSLTASLVETTDQEYNKLTSICLLALVIVAIKYFSVSEVSFVLKQISSVSGLTTTVFSVVVVVSPLVLLLNATNQFWNTVENRSFCCGINRVYANILLCCFGVTTNRINAKKCDRP
jgi:hypothetical protein